MVTLNLKLPKIILRTFKIPLGLQINDLNGENSTGVMIAQFTQKLGVRRSTARAFLRPARNRTNFHILVNSTVTKVLIENKVAKGKSLINFSRMETL